MNILYATDGSEGAKPGAEFLHHLPLTEQDSVCLLTVVQSEEGKAEGAPVLDTAQTIIGDTPATVHRYIRHGNAALEIIDAINWMAAEVSCDLIVVGTRGLTGIARFFLGSVAERVARFAPTSVLVAHNIHGPLRRIVIGFDGSRTARRAVDYVRKLPLTPDCEICLATMVTPSEAAGFLPAFIQKEIATVRQEERHTAEKGLQEMAQQLQESGVRVVTVVEEAEPASGLLYLAEQHKADLIVVGAQGHSEVELFLLGSVSDKVLRNSPCSTLIVRSRSVAA
ncbi:MAG: hypothetical protein OHK0029_07860 [Armatimonadaceae bacterium]